MGIKKQVVIDMMFQQICSRGVKLQSITHSTALCLSRMKKTILLRIRNGNIKCTLLHLLQGIFKDKDRKLAQTFNSSFCYVNNLPSLGSSWFGE